MIQSSVNRRLLHVTVDEGRLEFISALFRARVEKTHSRFLHYRYTLFKKKKKKRAENEPAQVSPFWNRATGGCMKSLKGPRASFRAKLTSDEVHVMHSTSVGYRPIT